MIPIVVSCIFPYHNIKKVADIQVQYHKSTMQTKQKHINLHCNTENQGIGLQLLRRYHCAWYFVLLRENLAGQAGLRMRYSVLEKPVGAVLLTLLANLAAPTTAIDNGMGRTPPLGWNTWCTDVLCTRDYCDESIVKTQIDAIEREGLRDIGWKYATLDDCWGGQRQPNGSYHWDQNRFPSGIPHLAEYAHSKGLLFGLYLGAGNETCSSGGKAQKVPGRTLNPKP